MINLSKIFVGQHMRALYRVDREQTGSKVAVCAGHLSDKGRCCHICTENNNKIFVESESEEKSLKVKVNKQKIESESAGLCPRAYLQQKNNKMFRESKSEYH